MSISASKKTILVIGATGRQGGAFISALTSSPNSNEYHILALTRNATHPTAQTLASTSESITVVEGNLDSLESLRTIFEGQLGKGGIWGVFCVLPFLGLGVNAGRVETQGKILIDLSRGFGVSRFILSTALPCGIQDNGDLTASSRILLEDPDRLAKVRVEGYLKDEGEHGKSEMTWTILRPGFFMEIYQYALGSLTFSIFKAGLKPTTTMRLIAVEDIGKVALGVFNDPSSFTSQTLSVVGDIATISEQEKSYIKATGHPIWTIPVFLVQLLIYSSGDVRHLLSVVEGLHEAHSLSNNSNAELTNEYRAQQESAQRAYQNIQTFEEWARHRYGPNVNETMGSYLWKWLPWNR